ncbi:hypothetical protein ACFOU2_10325 [Bacillus songklensis]|uniref:Uncharacterized protein n=1 Tax=Bacillus songklensis TaxID=1069116 RepID=A0ABV8B3Q9_9BACI
MKTFNADNVKEGSQADIHRGLHLKLEVGSKVLYDSEIYTIIYIYNNGYCEIRNENHQFEVLCVKLSELAHLE